ncbi:uncharacterized protein LOC129958496 isoform X2 [Argiope bruennichi]|uniref:uncharacterized protein LOC129958496 isoform X2 n=1 Tax=Argiope bruennichi TaxID=94029 RepID=UPI0024940D8E|nr:uncharacterized protein LOC129958496 isoform X2 [Argiope bruennichi]
MCSIRLTDLLKEPPNRAALVSKISEKNEQRGAIPKRIRKTDLLKEQPNRAALVSKVMCRIQKTDLLKEQPNRAALVSKVSWENQKRGAIPKCIQKTDLPKRQPNIAVSFSKMSLSNENLPALPIRIPKTDSEAIEKSDLTEVQPNVFASSSKKSKFAQGGRKEDTCQSSEPSTSFLVAEQMEEGKIQESEEYVARKSLESDEESLESDEQFWKKCISSLAEQMEEKVKLESEEYIAEKWFIDTGVNDYEFAMEPPPKDECLEFIDKGAIGYEFPIEHPPEYEDLDYSFLVAEQIEAKKKQEKEDSMTKKWVECDIDHWEFLGKGSTDIEFPIEPPPEDECLEVLGVKLDRLEPWAEDHFR